jgi:hypothetical protein
MSQEFVLEAPIFTCKLDTLTALVEVLKAEVIKTHDIVDCQIQT